MFFTKAGYILAWLIFLPSAIFYMVIQVAAFSGRLEALAESMGRGFVASSGTFAEGIALGIAFGIASEISRTLADRA